MAKWIYKRDTTKIYSDSDVFVDELYNKYGPDRHKSTIPCMEMLDEVQRPSDVENRVFGQIVQIINDVPTLVFEFEPRTPEDLQKIQDVIRRKAALKELETLDKMLPRGVEDIIDATSLPINTLPEVQQQRIARKAELRQVIADTQYLFEVNNNDN